MRVDDLLGRSQTAVDVGVQPVQIISKDRRFQPWVNKFSAGVEFGVVMIAHGFFSFIEDNNFSLISFIVLTESHTDFAASGVSA